MRLHIRWLVPMLATAVCACLPKDPEGTLSRVENGVLRVGVEANAPWVRLSGGQPEGVETELVRALARELNARIEWTAGPEARLMEGLRANELDLVAAGVDSRSPWAKSLGASLPYASGQTVVAFPGRAPPRKALAGLRVAARPSDPAAAKLRKKGAIVTATADPAATGDAALLERGEAVARGLQPDEMSFGSRQHVLLTPPGENAWLLRVDRFVEAHKPQVAGLMAREGRS